MRATRTVGPASVSQIPLGGCVVGEPVEELSQRDALPVVLARCFSLAHDHENTKGVSHQNRPSTSQSRRNRTGRTKVRRSGVARRRGDVVERVREAAPIAPINLRQKHAQALKPPTSTRVCQRCITKLGHRREPERACTRQSGCRLAEQAVKSLKSAPRRPTPTQADQTAQSHDAEPRGQARQQRRAHVRRPDPHFAAETDSHLADRRPQPRHDTSPDLRHRRIMPPTPPQPQLPPHRPTARHRCPATAHGTQARQPSDAEPSDLLHGSCSYATSARGDLVGQRRACLIQRGKTD